MSMETTSIWKLSLIHIYNRNYQSGFYDGEQFHHNTEKRTVPGDLRAGYYVRADHRKGGYLGWTCRGLCGNDFPLDVYKRQARQRTAGGVHEQTEIYYIVSGMGDVWLDETCYHVVPGDFIIIPPGTFHYIDNTMNDEKFVLMTFWSRQEYNEVYLSLIHI